MTTETPAPRRIEYLPLSELTPDPKNPKGHDLDVLDESMGRFGYVEAISRDDRTGYVISGHGRRENLIKRRDRGESAPEGVQVRDDGEWLVPVTVGWSSRTDTEATAALIALNRTTELGGWVDDELLGLLDNLTAEDGLTGVGYDEEAIEQLRTRLAEEELVDSFMQSQGKGEENSDDDSEDLIEKIGITAGEHHLVVVVPEERREEFYSIMNDLDWVIDVRDKN